MDISARPVYILSASCDSVNDRAQGLKGRGMAGIRRSTLIVHGRLAMRGARLHAARGGAHGLQVMSFEQAAVRLAGGFARPINGETLRETIQAVLSQTAMGEL